LNDFIPVTSIDDKKEISSNTIKKSHFDNNNSSKQKLRYYREISKEEKLYNRDMSTYLKMVSFKIFISNFDFVFQLI